MPKCKVPMAGCGSTQLKEFGYDPATKTLAIRFHGKSSDRFHYTYAGVPSEHYEGLMAADAHPDASVGAYFNEHIKNKPHYPHTKVDELADEEKMS